MNRLPLFALLLAIVALSGFLVGQNRPVPTRIGMVNSEKVIQAHKDFPKVKAVQDQAKRELDPLIERMRPLEGKVSKNTATAKDNQDLAILRNALRDATNRWNQRQAKELEPITQAIDKQIDTFAKAQGVALILDERVSSESALIIYRDDVVDLTDEIIKLLR